jgi:lysophospholipase L1-like esterase
VLLLPSRRRALVPLLLAAVLAVVAPTSVVAPSGAAGSGAAGSGAAGSGAAGSGAARSGEGAPRAALRYVALGDSYSAATGVLPLVPSAPPQCLRSQRNYPSVIAERTGARLTDVTCGAADTGDFAGSQGQGIAPQLDAVTRRADLVTMTIGGNDSNVFISAILQCGAAGLTTAGTGSPCRDTYGRQFVRTVRRSTFPDLKKALRAVHRKAPRAEVAILGYPRILPPRGGCFPQMPVARGDVPYLFDLQRVLNNVVRRAAKATGSVYVDVPRASRGHDACQRLGRRWVEPVLLGINPVIVHPNARGSAAMARVTMRRLGLLR